VTESTSESRPAGSASAESGSAQKPWEQPGWLTPREFTAKEGVEDWRLLGEGIYGFFRTDSFAACARLVQAIADLPEIDGDRPPDIDIRPDGVTVRLTTITVGKYFAGYDPADVEVARRISAVAREAGAAADPTRLQQVSVSIDAMAIGGVMPFWRETLGYEFRPDTDEDVVDPRGRGPSFWFQQMDVPRTERNRIHVDIAVPPEQVQDRVDAVLAAGGRRLHPDHPWILSDPEGNEVCLG
jgi:4a-hydroxytetrahydrobiopterin dehydratase